MSLGSIAGLERQPDQPGSRVGRKTDRKITPCLWSDDQGEEADDFYVSVFPNSKIGDVARYSEAGPRTAGTCDDPSSP
jgi:hypothetical protein